MDLDNIKNQVSNISLYDIKAGFRKAQNAVMNYTEMEAKVREATNNEPWGCPTSVMQEIANGTFNYATLNEIMPLIYKRFTEKSAEEWRQIYKSLQLLEFLIKNGSERVVDDARSHLSLLKMLRQFHYIDQNGKDQGINVRNRAKELGELLADVDRIRAERKKARATRNKYGGVEGGMGIGGAGSSRFGGFGNESGPGSASYGGYSGGVYGDGGGFGGNAADEYGDMQGRRDRFEEYDEYDEGGVTSPSRRRADPSGASRRSASKPENPKPKEPEVDLFDFGDDSISSPPAASNGKQAMPTSAASDFGALQSIDAGADDDDFDDFQSSTTTTTTTASSIIPPPASTSSTTSSTQFAAPRPVAPQSQAANINFLNSSISPPPPSTTPSGGANYSAFKAPPPQQTQQPMSAPLNPAQQQQAPRPTGYQAAQPNYFGSIQSSEPASSTLQPGVPGGAQPTASKPTSAAKKTATTGSDPFANLAVGGAKKPTASTSKGPTMADMARQKASDGIWGPNATSTQQPPQQQSGGGGAFGDLI